MVEARQFLKYLQCFDSTDTGVSVLKCCIKTALPCRWKLYHAKEVTSKESGYEDLKTGTESMHEAEICNAFYAHMVRIILVADSMMSNITHWFYSQS